MEKWEIEVKEHWNKISDSEWYQSLRTDDRFSELYNNPETAFRPEMLSLMKKYSATNDKLYINHNEPFIRYHNYR